MNLLLLIMLTSASFLSFMQSGQESTKFPHGSLDLECSLCHKTDSWVVNPDSIRFDHQKTGFQLLGQHSQATCRACHSSLNFAHIGVSCVDCHEDVHKSELGFQCQNCHTPASWNNVQEIFETHNETRFPLLGVHAVVDCESCHSSSDPYAYKNTPLECIACHQQVYLSAENPNHVQAQFSTDCEACHSMAATSWYITDYQHPSSFILRGAHLRVDCMGCHQSGYAGIPQNCYACHQQDYLSSHDPDHSKFGFPTTCETCHNENQWGDAEFDHLEISGFEIRGAHLTIQCISCHVNNQISGLPRECYGCHENDFSGVQDPNHVMAQFSHDCLECHSEMVWSPSTFDHAETRFALSGAHLSVVCGDCHINGQFAGTPLDCYSCHEGDYQAVTDPSHVQAQFDHDCRQCHTDIAWSPANFDHANTNFPLTGAHQQAACTDCHKNGQYTGLATDCYSCHEADYQGVTDPSHVQAQFDHDCRQCHTDIAWSPANFDHANTNFPLTGAHQQVACTDCHQNGQYTGLATDCYSCHENEYTNTSDPNHTNAGFPVTCEDCHNTIAWDQTSWDHDAQYFPIYSGRHAQEWDTCADCHLVPTDYKQFECIFCHAHNNETDLADKHREENGYLYQSSACYDCHPTGRAAGD